MIKTKAFVFKNIKTKDNTHIIKLYTLELGLLSFVVTVSKTKGKVKPSYLLPLAALEVSFEYHPTKDIQRLSDVTINSQYNQIHESIMKQSILYFISEVFEKSIKEIEKNEQLFQFIETTLVRLSSAENLYYFTIQFLVDLSLHIGIIPDDNYSKEEPIFNMAEGKFLSENSIHLHSINSDESLLLHQFLEGNHNLHLSKEQRNRMVNVLVNYFEMHIPDFGKVKSLEVLEEVFI